MVTAVARRHDVHPNLLHHWRRQAKRAGWGRAGIEVPAGCGDAFGAAVRRGSIEIELAGSLRVRVDAAVDEAALGRVARAGGGRPMIALPSETRVWLASGATDMRRGFDGLALQVQEVLRRDPHCGHLFVFRGKRGGSDQGALARRPGHVPVQPSGWSAAASCGRRRRDGVVTISAGAARLSARGDRLGASGDRRETEGASPLR